MLTLQEHLGTEAHSDRSIEKAYRMEQIKWTEREYKSIKKYEH